MKKILRTLVLLLAAINGLTATAQSETLSRGIVSIHKTSGGNFVSWRLLPSDPKGVTFDLLRDGAKIKTGLTVTSFADANGTTAHRYQVVARADGQDIDTSREAQTWSGVFKTMTLERPEGGSFSYTKGQLRHNLPSKDSIGYYTYYAMEGSMGDADGDGELELVVKFNLGPNIRTGSHYTQFLYYDFNGDGRCELICKTGPGSVDGQGRYVSEAADDETIRATDNSRDYRTTLGRIMSGPEFLTVFDGLSGRAMHTIWYNPNRGMTTGRASGYTESWGDDYGNRGEHFLACAAHLDGPDKPASAVMCRGYYTRAYLWADGHLRDSCPFLRRPRRAVGRHRAHRRHHSRRHQHPDDGP